MALQGFIEVTTLAEDYLIFRLGDLTIKAFYLALSLSNGAIARAFTRHMTGVDLAIGDFNVRL